LVNEINSVGGNNYILIGHSQGGLISRYAAQYFQGSPPNKVRGVVTMDTPHEGADLIQNGPVIGPVFGLLGALLWDWTGCYTPWDNAACLLGYLAFNVGPPFGAVFTVVGATPDIVDLTAGSAFLTSLNAYPETFAQAAVVGNTPQRWNESRIAWDFLAPYIYPPYTCDPNYYPESACGEGAVAALVGATYDYIEALLIISIFDEIFARTRAMPATSI
jgi:pimeloyl-ACP methyl ester carboxylesterase